MQLWKSVQPTICTVNPGVSAAVSRPASTTMDESISESKRRFFVWLSPGCLAMLNLSRSNCTAILECSYGVDLMVKYTWIGMTELRSFVSIPIEGRKGGGGAVRFLPSSYPPPPTRY